MHSKLLRIAVLVSGNGSNFQALIEGKKSGVFASEINLVVSNRKNAFALDRARENKIEALYIDDDKTLLATLINREIDLIVLAGYLKFVSRNILTAFENKIINIHPSLLPKYGGKGMYGIHVHEAVFKNNERESGATVHYTTSEIDRGNIIIQKKIDISQCESPKQIQSKVLTVEHKILGEALKLLEEGYYDEKSFNQCNR